MKKLILITAILSAAVVTSIEIRSLHAEGKTSIDAFSKIDRVMVYQDRALVTRTALLEKLPAGTSEVMFANLPMLLQDDSVRAKIVDGDAKILDVEVRTVLLEKAPELKIRQLQEKQQRLQDDRTRLQNKIKVLQYEFGYLTEAKKHFLDTGSGKKNTDRDNGEKGYTKYKIEEYEAMQKYLNDKFQINANAQFKEELEIRGVDTQIELVRSELSKLNAGQSMSPNKKMVKVVIDASKNGSYKIELSYINYKVKWKPGYDIRVFIDDLKTEFTGYGVVDQSSGEDWISSLISYSTAQPSVGGYLPELIPLYATISSKLNLGYDNKGQDFAAQNTANRMVLGGNIPGGGDASMADGVDADVQSDTTAERKGGSLVFHVPRRSDIPSDGSPHRTAISRQTFPVRFEFSSVPRLSPHAYLQAIGNNNMALPILRGDLNIFMGNDFVGSSNTGNIMPGEDFELTLGVNDNIRVTRVLDEKGKETAGFLSGSQKTNFSFIIKAENYTGKDIVMNIFDQIPVSENEDIEISNVTFSHKPFKQNKKGIVQWQLKMKQKEVVQITFGFTVNVPKGKDLAFFRTDLAPATYIQNKQSFRKDSVNQSSFEYQADEDKRDYKQKAPAMKKH